MKLWGGRFTKETNELVNNFNASISFDQKFYKQDIEGSIAHATMLGKQGIIPESESEVLREFLLILNQESLKSLMNTRISIHLWRLLLLRESVMPERDFTQDEAEMTRLLLI